MRLFGELTQDVRYAIRSIGRQPGLAIATVLTLALGLGLNVGVFTFLRSLLFGARVDKDPASFLHLSPEYRTEEGRRMGSWLVSVRDYRAYAAGAETIGGLAAWAPVHATLGSGEAGPQLALLVTCNFFDVYGLAAPRMGRLFSPAECGSPGAGPVVLLGEEVWKSQFDSDTHIVGRVLRINRVPFTVAGVLPAGFAGRIRGPGIWIPWTMQRLFFQNADLFRLDSTPWLTVEGRLKSGRTRRQAQAELAVIAARQDRLEPGRRTTMHVTNGSFGEEPALRESLFWIGPVVMGALALILLLACTNATVLQLARAVTRRREMGIRLSLGAGRPRLMRMLLTEMFVLAALAGALSAYLAFQAPAVFAKMIATPGMPVYQTRPDWTVMLFLGAIVVAATFLAGLSPAGLSLRVDLQSAMKPGGAGMGIGAARRRGVLIASQVAMSLVLLAGAGVFVRAQHAMFTADPGFETRRVLFLPLPVPLANAAEAVRGVAGVESVASGSPLSAEEQGPATQLVRAAGQLPGAERPAVITEVSTNYFGLLGIRLLQGRSPGNAQEAVVSGALARSVWPGKDPVGERIVLADGRELAIAGVAPDQDGPHLYRWRDMSQPVDSLLIRFRGDAATISPRVREAIWRLDPDNQAWPRTLRAILDETAERFSVVVRMAGVLAGLALLLAVLGIYGVAAFAASQRTRELGIRAALGATRSMVVRSVLASGARSIAWGIGVGAPAAWIGTHAVAKLLHHSPVSIRPNDPTAFLAVAALLGLAGFAAMFRPAWRASQADPVRALRDE